MPKRAERAERTQAENEAGPALAQLVEPMLAGMTTTRQHLLAWVHAHGLPRWTSCFARRPWRWQAPRGGTRSSARIITGDGGDGAYLRRAARAGAPPPRTADHGRGSDIALGRGVPRSGPADRADDAAGARRGVDAGLRRQSRGAAERAAHPGSSKSAVSRAVVRRTRQRLHEHLARRLDGLEVVALFMDGVVVAQQTVIVVLGITRDGGKVPLGLRLGSTENAVVCTELLQDLLARGLTLGGGCCG